MTTSGTNSLYILSCYGNQLQTLDLSTSPELHDLYCARNILSSINVSSNIKLSYMDCSDNLFTNLNLNNNIFLERLTCIKGRLTNLDLSNTKIIDLTIPQNPLLKILNIKNGLFTALYYMDGNTGLEYICADEADIVEVNYRIAIAGLTNCNVNTYCSFAPGGIFYSITGNNKFDTNLNGCDANDNKIQNLKFKIANGINEATFISNNSGNYSIPVQSGTHTITPVLENPSYFNVSPTSATITFPATASPAIQDFCVTANGVHNDLKVTLLPINVARPGFDAKYKLVYKNKGNQTQSGVVSLTFSDAVLDLISANPATSTQTLNNLSWNFIDLKPFETREIAITLNANSPMETPPLNVGSILSFTANVTASNDETPNDNIAILNQTVVNSFDPNDKTCLEGNDIAPAKVGDYVHYMIRFENTGTFAA